MDWIPILAWFIFVITIFAGAAFFLPSSAKQDHQGYFLTIAEENTAVSYYLPDNDSLKYCEKIAYCKKDEGGCYCYVS